MKRKERAKFIGSDGSCGLLKGRLYTVEVISHEDGPYAYHVYVKEIMLGIPYSSMKAILKNWKFV